MEFKKYIHEFHFEINLETIFLFQMFEHLSMKILKNGINQKERGY
jgi:hypothetical protein